MGRGIIDETGVRRADSIVAFLTTNYGGEPSRYLETGDPVPGHPVPRGEEGLLGVDHRPYVLLWDDGPHDGQLAEMVRVARRAARVRNRRIEVVRFTLREHVRWVEP